jgi:hypothetical protein
MTTLKPRNLIAQLHYRAAGNPPSTLASSAISNSFPGLEFDFRNAWRRVFVGITLMENSNFVAAAEPPHEHLVEHRLLRVAGHPVIASVTGPQMPGGQSGPLASSTYPEAAASMELSNALVAVLHAHQGSRVVCELTRDKAYQEVALPSSSEHVITATLEVRRWFDADAEAGAVTGERAVLAGPLIEPGELTQGLCSPWQNDYRECACYYWAASRPDYVNVTIGPDGLSRGDNWMQKQRTGEYLLDDRKDSRLVSYDDLFRDWEAQLRFQIGGRDEPQDAHGRAERDRGGHGRVDPGAGTKPGGES